MKIKFGRKLLTWSICSIGCLFQLYTTTKDYLEFAVHNDVAYEQTTEIELPDIDILFPIVTMINMTTIFIRHPEHIIELCNQTDKPTVEVTVDNFATVCAKLCLEVISLSSRSTNFLSVADIEDATKDTRPLVKEVVWTVAGEKILESSCNTTQYFNSNGLYLRISCRNGTEPLKTSSNIVPVGLRYYAVLFHNFGPYYGIRFSAPGKHIDSDMNNYQFIIREGAFYPIVFIRYSKIVTRSLAYPYKTNCKDLDKLKLMSDCLLNASLSQKDKFIFPSSLVKFKQYDRNLAFLPDGKKVVKIYDIATSNAVIECAKFQEFTECESINYEIEIKSYQENISGEMGRIYIEPPVKPTICHTAYPMLPLKEYIIFVGSILGLWFGFSIFNRLSSRLPFELRSSRKIHSMNEITSKNQLNSPVVTIDMVE